ncbi:hypothetical protein, partial [Mesomycoplasma hyorhinis]|uniref:hypothetical protein n=1 Tax=Mesomycoplasma hyorhinis TaxID=2100 RepID=UPI001C04F4E4
NVTTDTSASNRSIAASANRILAYTASSHHRAVTGVRRRTVLVTLYSFFFQPKEGIQDQPRSRGLGDVYKFWLIFLLSR